MYIYCIYILIRYVCMYSVYVCLWELEQKYQGCVRILSALLGVSVSFVGEATCLIVGWSDPLIAVIFRNVDVTWLSCRIPQIPSTR